MKKLLMAAAFGAALVSGQVFALDPEKTVSQVTNKSNSNIFVIVKDDEMKKKVTRVDAYEIPANSNLKANITLDAEQLIEVATSTGLHTIFYEPLRDTITVDQDGNVQK